MNGSEYYRCPHCFTVVRPGEYHMQCSNRKCTGDREIDTEKCILLGVDPHGPNPITTQHHIVRNGNVCDVCGAVLKTRLCPKCHHIIRTELAAGDLNAVMFLAPHNCGLSHYMVSLVRVMHNVAKREFNGNLKAADGMVYDCMQKQYLSYISRGMVIPSSKSPPEPIVYNLNCASKNLTLVFVDVACNKYGLPNLNRGSDIEGIMRESSGIVLLIDPETEETTHASANILFHITELLHDSEEIDADGKITIPLAVVLAKADLLMTGDNPLLGPWSSVHMARLPKELDDLSFTQIDMEVREIVKRISGEETVETAESYRENMFFAVSAIGYTPVEGSLTRGIEPFRVEDPLIWLLGRR